MIKMIPLSLCSDFSCTQFIGTLYEEVVGLEYSDSYVELFDT